MCLTWSPRCQPSIRFSRHRTPCFYRTLVSRLRKLCQLKRISHCATWRISWKAKNDETKSYNTNRRTRKFSIRFVVDSDAVEPSMSDPKSPSQVSERTIVTNQTSRWEE